MLWEAIVGKLIGQAAPKVADYFINKAERKAEFKLEQIRQIHEIELRKLEGKAAWEAAKTKRAIQSEGFDHEWEKMSLMQHSKGWKQYFVLIVVSIPAIGAFIPYYQPYISEGFVSLEATPLWYQVLLTSIFFAVYGIRVYRRQAFEKNILLEKREPKATVLAK